MFAWHSGFDFCMGDLECLRPRRARGRPNKKPRIEAPGAEPQADPPFDVSDPESGLPLEVSGPEAGPPLDIPELEADVLFGCFGAPPQEEVPQEEVPCKATSHFELFGFQAPSKFELAGTILEHVFAGPHAWKMFNSDQGNTRYSRYVRLLVSNIFLSLQGSRVATVLDAVEQAAVPSHIVVRHSWDETQQLVLSPMVTAAAPPTGGAAVDEASTGHAEADETSALLAESVVVPACLQLGGFKSSLMPRMEPMVFPCVRLAGQSAQCIRAGMLAVSGDLLSEQLWRRFAAHWVGYVFCTDDAKPNSRICAYYSNLSEGLKVVVLQLVCLIHLLHTQSKPGVGLLQVLDPLYRWAQVSRIASFRQFHFSRADAFMRKHFIRVTNSEPNKSHTFRLRQLLQLCRPARGPQAARLSEEVVQFFAGSDLRVNRVIHHCQCCPNEETAKNKCSRLMWQLLFRKRLKRPKASDWLAINEVIAICVLGHCFFSAFNLATILQDAGAETADVEARATQQLPSSEANQDFAAEHGVRVAKTILFSADRPRFAEMMMYLVCSQPQGQLKSWLLKYTSGLHPRYGRQKDLLTHPTWLLLTPQRSPLWKCMSELCMLLADGGLETHFGIVWHYFPDIGRDVLLRFLTSLVLPLATRIYVNLFRAVAGSHPFTAFQCTNPLISADEREWFRKKLRRTHRCCVPLGIRRVLESIPPSSTSVPDPTLSFLNDLAEAVEWTIINIEHGHGRLRWLSRHGSNHGGAFMSTMTSHQVYTASGRNHKERADRRKAEYERRAAAAPTTACDDTRASLRREAEEAKGSMRIPARVYFFKKAGMSLADGQAAWAALSDEERDAWSTIAGSARQAASKKYSELKRQLRLIAADEDAQMDDDDAAGGHDEAGPGELHTPWDLGDDELPLTAALLASDPLLENSRKPNSRGWGDRTGELPREDIMNKLAAWAAKLNERQPVDQSFGETKVKYDNCCESFGFCRTACQRRGKWISLLTMLEAYLGATKSFARSDIQSGRQLVMLHARGKGPETGSGPGTQFWIHLALTHVANSPKYTVWGIRLELADEPGMLRDGPPPCPPYDLKLEWSTFDLGPREAPGRWELRMWSFMMAAEVVEALSRDESWTVRGIVPLVWRPLEGPTFGFQIVGHGEEMVWWDGGPRKCLAATDEPAAHPSDLAGLRAAPKPRAKPHAKRTPKASKKAGAKDADPKRKLTDQEKLELRLFGVLPEGVVAEEVAVSDIEDDAEDGQDGPGSNDVDLDLSAGVGQPGVAAEAGDSDPSAEEDAEADEEAELEAPAPAAIDFSVGPKGFISHDAAATLICPHPSPVHAGSRKWVYSPLDPSRLIGELQLRSHTGLCNWAAVCKICTHKGRCSRMSSYPARTTVKEIGDGKLTETILVRWLVRGLGVEATETNTATQNHMAMVREKITRVSETIVS